MTEPSTEAAPEIDRPAAEIEFAGRQIMVRMPTESQLVIWKRTLDNLQRMGPDTQWTADTVVKLLLRARKIIDSIMVQPDDVEWLDDAMLDGEISLPQSVEIITLAVAAFKSDGNREERRASGKKSTRRKATT